MATKKKKRKTKGRTAAQREATRKMIAANKARRGGRKKSSTTKHKKKRTSEHKKRMSGIRSLSLRVSNLETFAGKQRHVNTIMRDSIQRLYRHTKLTTPTALLRGNNV